VTLVLQGLPLPWVIRWLRIPRDEPRVEEHRLARIRTAQAARDRLDRLIADGDELTRQVGGELRTRYQQMLSDLEDEARGGRMHAELTRLRRELAQAQRAALLDLHARGLIDSETFRRIERELDLEEQIAQ
jgi:CPA1 family monovalent cation:H+ antiporter